MTNGLYCNENLRHICSALPPDENLQTGPILKGLRIATRNAGVREAATTLEKNYGQSAC